MLVTIADPHFVWERKERRGTELSDRPWNRLTHSPCAGCMRAAHLDPALPAAKPEKPDPTGAVEDTIFTRSAISVIVSATQKPHRYLSAAIR
jgi:hypothetical protein